MTAQLTGDKELVRKLNQLGTKGAKKATRAGIRAAMTPVAKAVRAGVNATTASPELKRAARKAIVTYFSQSKGVAKVGWPKDVKASKGKRLAAHERSVSSKPGVGVSITNIHWFILGTKVRKLKHRALIPADEFGTPRTMLAGKKTGRIKPVMSDVIPNATMQSAGASVEAARQKIQQVIEREARKRA